MEMNKGGKRMHLLDSLLSGVIVLYATYLMRNAAGSKALLSVLFLLLAAESALRLSEGKRTKTQRFCVMALYLVGAALILVLEPFHSSLLAAAAVEFAVLLFNRVAAIMKKPKKRAIVFNVICILLIIYIAFVFFGSDMLVSQTVNMDEAELQENPNYTSISESMDQLEELDESFSGMMGLDILVYILLMLLILVRMILHVVGISISQMKLNVLMNIIRETYVLEIVLGLVLMIIACSSIFTTLEPNMNEYWDALWYSFALVTTIGFGDITASTMIGRALSVFLGIYGIVVVAIITSVIVNFYGEMRRIRKPDGEEGEAEERTL